MYLLEGKLDFPVQGGICGLQPGGSAGPAQDGDAEDHGGGRWGERGGGLGRSEATNPEGERLTAGADSGTMFELKHILTNKKLSI